MRRLQRRIIAIIIIVLLLSQVVWATNGQVDQEESFVIGVLSFESKSETYKKWQPLAEYLTETIPYQNFTVLPLTYVDFDQVLEESSVDYVLTNPAHYIAMRQKFQLSGAIATLTELSGGESQSSFGGVIFSKNVPGAPSTIEELRHKKISAVNRNSLGGYQASAYELQKEGISLNNVEFVLTGMPHKNTIEMVLNGEADAGFVRSGVIEDMITNGELSTDALKIINQQPGDRFSQLVSTSLYPEWPFIAMAHIESLDAQKVAASLFLLHESTEYAETIGIYGFTIPASYLSVEEMMRALKMAPFDQQHRITLSELWAFYNMQIVIGLIVLLTLFFYAVNKNITGKLLAQKNETLNALTTELKRVNDELHKLAVKDPLTGLYNRRFFEEYLDEKLELTCVDHQAVGICIIDVDNFKFYNDEYGHWVGDQVLTAVANALRNQEDQAIGLVARYAGDEFIIILDDVTLQASELIAHRIIKNMASLKINVQGVAQPLRVTISMGIALSNQRNCNESNALFKAADHALLDAKEKGKNRYAVYYTADV